MNEIHDTQSSSATGPATRPAARPAGRPTAQTPRRRKPHPARRARRVTGAAGVGALVMLTGYMTLQGVATAGSSSATRVASPATSATSTKSVGLTASAATPGATAVTSSQSS